MFESIQHLANALVLELDHKLFIIRHSSLAMEKMMDHANRIPLLLNSNNLKSTKNCNQHLSFASNKPEIHAYQNQEDASHGMLNVFHILHASMHEAENLLRPKNNHQH